MSVSKSDSGELQLMCSPGGEANCLSLRIKHASTLNTTVLATVASDEVSGKVNSAQKGRSLASLSLLGPESSNLEMPYLVNYNYAAF